MDHISNFCKCLDYVLGGDHAAFEHGWVAGFPHRAMATHRIDCAAIYGVPWIPSIYPSHVSIYTSTMDPMGIVIC
jgi:hypothetical protein